MSRIRALPPTLLLLAVTPHLACQSSPPAVVLVDYAFAGSPTPGEDRFRLWIPVGGD